MNTVFKCSNQISNANLVFVDVYYITYANLEIAGTIMSS